MISITQANILIVGLGLMGGSLAAALSPHCHHISAQDRDPDALDFALSRGLITQAIPPQSDLSQFDWIILALPVRESIRWLQTNASSLTSPAILLDLCSTKFEITQVMQTLPNNLFAIGGHPMCGKETNGIHSAQADLFHGKKFILTPLANRAPAFLEYILEMIDLLGSAPLLLDPFQHDQIVAQVSHLPHLLATTLITTTQSLAEKTPQTWELAASGFESTTRIVASDPSMRLDILLTNQAAILASLEKFQTQLTQLHTALKTNDEFFLCEFLIQAQAIRSAR